MRVEATGAAFRIVPELPTTQPVFASVKWTSFRYWVVPDVCAVHVVPPLQVFRFVPTQPTTQPVFASVKWTSFRYWVVPDVCAVHVVPPLPVFRIVPA